MCVCINFLIVTQSKLSVMLSCNNFYFSFITGLHKTYYITGNKNIPGFNRNRSIGPTLDVYDDDDVTKITLFFFILAQQPQVCQDLLIHGVSRSQNSHIETLNNAKLCIFCMAIGGNH